MYTLALETSCDETSVAVIEDGRRILSNIISTQVPIHRKFGGVVPEIASRQHIEYVMPVVKEALEEAEITLNDVDHIGVTYGPGLVGALLVGVATAKALSFAADKPLVGVNHMEGHIFANFLSHTELEPPFLALVVSGGHTQLVKVLGYNRFELMGQTRDDAAGEAFDKIARVMGYPYPGGPQIDKLAALGNADAVVFPKALHERNNVVLAGGVAANHGLTQAMETACKEKGYTFYKPEPILCTDNGAMIGCRAYYMAQDGRFADMTLNAKPALSLTGTET